MRPIGTEQHSTVHPGKPNSFTSEFTPKSAEAVLALPNYQDVLMQARNHFLIGVRKQTSHGKTYDLLQKICSSGFSPGQCRTFLEKKPSYLN